MQLERVEVQGRRRKYSRLSNKYLDNVFTFKDLLGLEKT